MRAWILVVAIAAACGGDDREYKNLYAGACGLDLEHPGSRADLLAEMWQHPDTRADLQALAAAPVRERGVLVARALTRAGLDRCQDRGIGEIEASAYFGARLAQVTSRHLPAEREIPLVRVTPSAIVVGGQMVAAVQRGAVEPSAKAGGALGIEIEVLVAYMQSLVKTLPDDPRIALAIDRELPYRLVIEVLYSLKLAKVRRFALLVDTGEVAAIELTLPSKRVGGIGEQIQPKLGLFVSASKSEIVVWSISKLEGTLREPRYKLAPTEVDKLARALVEIRDRHWPGGERPRADHQIVLQLEGALPAQQLLAIAAATAIDPAGKPLFPDIMLSSGFE